MWLKIKAVSSDVWQYIKPMVVLLLTTVGKELMAAAIAAVTKAAKSGLSNSAKREMAYQQIRSDMVAAGYQAAESAINLALEMAVQKIKEK